MDIYCFVAGNPVMINYSENRKLCRSDRMPYVSFQQRNGKLENQVNYQHITTFMFM
jgi:hypothetical protein